MPRFVAFLRAINLGSQRTFPKGDIVRVTGAAGFSDVVTHINTGNVCLQTTMRSRAKVEATLERAYLDDRGFEVPTIAFTTQELAQILVDADEIAEGYEGPRYVSLLKDAPTAAQARELEGKPTGEERAVVRGRAVHMLYPEGYGTARFTNAQVEKALGVSTNRNLTVIRAVVTKWC